MLALKFFTSISMVRHRPTSCNIKGPLLKMSAEALYAEELRSCVEVDDGFSSNIQIFKYAGV